MEVRLVAVKWPTIPISLPAVRAVCILVHGSLAVFETHTVPKSTPVVMASCVLVHGSHVVEFEPIIPTSLRVAEECLVQDHGNRVAGRELTTVEHIHAVVSIECFLVNVAIRNICSDRKLQTFMAAILFWKL